MGGRGSGNSDGIGYMTSSELNKELQEKSVAEIAMDNESYRQEKYPDLDYKPDYASLKEAFEYDLDIHFTLINEGEFTDDMVLPLNLTYNTLKEMQDRDIDISLYRYVEFSKDTMRYEADPGFMMANATAPRSKGRSTFVLNILNTNVREMEIQAGKDSKSGWSTSYDFPSMVKHEFGHAVQKYMDYHDPVRNDMLKGDYYDLQQSFNQTIKSYTGKVPSSFGVNNPNMYPSIYSHQNSMETFAESFSLIMEGKNSGYNNSGSAFVESTRNALVNAKDKSGDRLFPWIKEPVSSPTPTPTSSTSSGGRIPSMRGRG